MTYTLPPPFERFVRFPCKEVFLQLVRLKPKQVLIAHLPVQVWVFDRALKSLLARRGARWPARTPADVNTLPEVKPALSRRDVNTFGESPRSRPSGRPVPRGRAAI